MGLLPEQVAFVGDSSSDLGSAQAAGCVSIGVTWGAHPRSELEAAPWDHLVDTMDELNALLRQD